MAAAGSGGIFISYRRQEASHLAGRLYDRLADRFGEPQVFMDVDTIELGVDFAEVITQAVGTCEVLLAVIGPYWLSATDEQGDRRLDDPDDIVRLEIEAALARDVRVIPILVEGARMPSRHDLPESLASLARRNALTVRHESFRYDAERLITTIQRVLRVGTTATAPPGPPATAQAAPRPPENVQAEPRTTVPTKLNEHRFLRSLDDNRYREALRGLFNAAKALDMTFEWGSAGSSIRLHTPDRAEPLTVAWVFPGRSGWSGLRHLSLGYNTGSAANTPSVQDALSEYVNAVGRVPGATRAKARALHAYTFAPEAVYTQQDQLVRLLRTLARRVQDNWHRGPDPGSDHAVDGSAATTPAQAFSWPPVDVVTAPAELQVLRHDTRVIALAFSPDGRLLATASSSGPPRVWDLASGQERARRTKIDDDDDPDDDEARGLAFSPDGRLLATASSSMAQVWDVASGQERTRLTHDDSVVSGIAFSPDGRLLATAGASGFLDHASEGDVAVVWDLASGKERIRLTHDSDVEAVAFSPDGRLLATAGADKTARVWGVATGQQRARILHDGPVHGVVFSPDGRLLATASDDHTSRLWELASGQERTRIVHDGPVYGVAFSPDGRLLATACRDHKARLWELASGKERARVVHDGRVYGVAFSPDGRLLATASLDNTARVWALQGP